MSAESEEIARAFIQSARTKWWGRMLFGSEEDEGPVTRQQKSGGRVIRRQGVHANVQRACKKCQAPGRYLSEDSIRDGWPGCYVAKGDEREGQPVEGDCPNCGAPRPKSEALGEIWHKEYR